MPQFLITGFTYYTVAFVIVHTAEDIYRVGKWLSKKSDAAPEQPAQPQPQAAPQPEAAAA